VSGSRGCHWFLAPASPPWFPARPAVSTGHRPSHGCPCEFILPYASRPFEDSASLPPHASQHEAPSLGFAFPLRDISRRHRHGGFPHPPPSLLGVSHALEGLFRLQPCGFISPRCHVQGSPTRCSPRTALPPRRRQPALSSLAIRRCRRFPVGSTVRWPRPQGLSPCESSGTQATVFSRRLGPPPRESFLLQVLSLADSGPPSRPLRSRRSRKIRRCRPLRSSPASHSSSSLASLSQGCRPARGL
jgi:hypothetical protein